MLAAVTLLLSACGETSDTTTEKADTTTSALITTTPLTTDPTVTTPTETKNPPSLLYAEMTVGSVGYVKVASDSYISGTLLDIREGNPYQYNLPTLKVSHKIQDHVLRIPAQNLMILFGNTSQNYLLKSSKLFYKEDAFPYLDAMMAAFSKDSGRTSAQIVNAYLYSDPTTLTNEYVAGYSIAMNMLENGATYSLTAPEFSFTYGDKTVTCLDWFIENCPYYGFVYTGSSGSAQQALATFRFVGVPHALAMQKLEVTNMEIYLRTIQIAEKRLVITDDRTGKVWYIFYQEAHKTNTDTVIEIPAGATFTISGDNVGGFVVAYSVSAE